MEFKEHFFLQKVKGITNEDITTVECQLADSYQMPVTTIEFELDHYVLETFFLHIEPETHGVELHKSLSKLIFHMLSSTLSLSLGEHMDNEEFRYLYENAPRIHEQDINNKLAGQQFHSLKVTLPNKTLDGFKDYAKTMGAPFNNVLNMFLGLYVAMVKAVAEKGM